VNFYRAIAGDSLPTSINCAGEKSREKNIKRAKGKRQKAKVAPGQEHCTGAVWSSGANRQGRHFCLFALCFLPF